jgi:UDP-galactopyranose mutase
LPFKREILKSHKYLKKFPEWFFSIGRAGTYRYEVDIDDAIEQAMEIKKIIDNNNYQNAMPLQKWWEIK